MASKTFTAYHKNTSNKYGIQVVCTSTTNVAANTSTLTAVFSIIHPRIDISSRTGKLIIDGKTYSFTTGAIAKTGPTQVFTKTVQIVHNNDGTRKVPISASFPFDMTSGSYGRLGTVSGSGEMVLDNIPRSSVIKSRTASVVADGVNEFSLTLTKYATAFRHKATLSFGNEKITTAAFDTTTSVVVPVSWLNLIPTQKESTVNVSVQTYTDSTCKTTVGSARTTTFTIKVPTDAAPVLNEGWAKLAIYNAGTAADGMNAYVQGFSRAQAAFDSSLVELKYGATGATYSVVCGGVTDGSMTPVFTTSGTKTITCIAKDSRGFQSSQDFEIEVHPYFLPTLSGISLYRCNTSGVEDDEGTMLFFKASCRLAECGGENQINMIAEWKNVSGAYWGNATALVNGKGSVLGSGAVSPTSSYNARITATDRLGNAVSYAALISTANVAFHLRKGGKGGAFGKYGERDGLLDCDWDLLVRGDAEIQGAAQIGGNISAQGAIEAASANIAGEVAGENATFTGEGTFGSVKSNGAVSGTNASFSGAVSGASGSFTGNLSASGTATLKDSRGKTLTGGELVTNTYIDAFSVANSTNVSKLLFTAPVTGLYIITATITWASNSEGARTFGIMDTDNSTYLSASTFYAQGTGGIQQNATAIIRLTQGQKINARVWQNSGGALNAQWIITRTARIGA